MQISGSAVGRMNFFARAALALGSFVLFVSSAAAQVPSCSAGGHASVHIEGLAEKMGDITLNCTGGAPGSTVSSSFLVGLNATVTNRIAITGSLTGISATVNSGFGPIPAPVTASLSGLTGVTISGVTYTVPTPNTQLVTIVLSGIRVAIPSVTGGANNIVSATIFGTGVQVTNSQLPLLAIANTSLLATVVNNAYPCSGSGTPLTLDFNGLSAAGTVSSAVRVTEAYSSSFLPRDPSADSGIRILVKISGYGANAQVYVPNAIVGSSGSVPTSGGEFGTGFNGGSYVPGNSQLLMFLVNGADSNGGGGGSPTAPGTATAFSGVTQINLLNGAGYAVYEVADSNPNQIEWAQIPVFVAAPTATGSCSAGQGTLSPQLAPVSSVAIASSSDPIPRFIATTPSPDCQQVGDCNAFYNPTLQLSQTDITITGAAQGVVQTSNLQVNNSGSGQISYTLSINYQTGSNWLSTNPTSGVNFTNFILTADPSSLTQGTYLANVVINAGSSGTVTVPVTFNVTAPTPTLRSVVNAASQQAGPIVPGSFATVYGSTLNGKVVQVMFNGYPANVVFDAAGQINVLVPAVLSSSQPAGVYATIDGVISNTVSVAMAANAPAIFNPGVLNQDNSVNQTSQPAAVGSFVQIFVTGLSIAGPVTVNIGSSTGLAAAYAGVVPSIPGLEQVNIQIPAGLTFTGNTTPISICAQGTCSPTVNLYVKAGI